MSWSFFVWFWAGLRGTKISESRWRLSRQVRGDCGSDNFWRLSLTKARPGCAVVWLQAKLSVGDSEADLFHTIWSRAPRRRIKRLQISLLDAPQPLGEAFSRQACDLYFPHCERCHKNPVHRLLIVLFLNEREMLGSRSLLRRQVGLRWFDLIYFSLFHDFAAVLNTEMVVPSSTSALSGIHWLPYPDSKSSQAK